MANAFYKKRSNFVLRLLLSIVICLSLAISFVFFREWLASLEPYGRYLFVVWYFFFREKPIVVTVVSRIDDYNYYLDSNETRIYKKYYKELEKELEDNKVDEKKYFLTANVPMIITPEQEIVNKDVEINGEEKTITYLKDKQVILHF